MFDKMKAMMDMQKKMNQMKKELENTTFEISSSDGLVKLTMDGAQEVRAVILQGQLNSLDKITLENSIKDAYNRAIKRSHEIATSKMKDIVGFNIPGLT